MIQFIFATLFIFPRTFPCILLEGSINVQSVHSFQSSKQYNMPRYWENKPFTSSSCCCSVAKSYPTLCNPMDCSLPCFPVPHNLSELVQTHWVGDAMQPTHSLSSPSPALDLSKHQGLFQWVTCSHQMAKVLELQLQHQSLQWIFSVDFL